VVSRCGKDLCDGFICSISGSVKHGEVEVSRVAILADVDEAKCSSAFEDETSTISHVRPVELRDDVSEDVVALHDSRIDTIGISTSSDLMPSQH
jgi:hypothetical protein